MTGAQPTVEVHGAKQAAVDLKALGDRASDIRRLSERVRSIYRKSNERRFSGGAGWPPLDPDTIERKQRAGYVSGIERRTGALHRALTSARAADQIDVRDPTEFRFGTTLRYAKFQQGTKTQPPRDLIDLTPAERRQIDELISKWIARGQNV